MPPQFVPPAASQDIRPGRFWYAIAAGLVVVTLVGCALLGFSSVQGMMEMFDLRPVQVPGTTRIHLERPGRYALYVQTGSSTNVGPATYQEGHAPANLDFTVTPAGGEPLPLATGNSQMTLTVNSRQYRSLKSFAIDRPGDIIITAASGSNDGAAGIDVQVGPEEDFSHLMKKLGGFIGAGLMGLLGIGGAVTIFIVVIVKRSRAKRPATGVTYATWQPTGPPPVVQPPQGPPPLPPLPPQQP